MSEKYKIVISQNNECNAANLWVVGCPLMLEKAQVSRNKDTRETFVQTKFLNICTTKIARLQFSISVENEDGTSDYVECLELDADIDPGAHYVGRVVQLDNPLVKSVRVLIQEVTFGDGRSWIAANDEHASPPQPLTTYGLDQNQLNARNRILADASEKPDAMKYQFVDSGKYWTCVCGQPNIWRDSCCSCRIKKATLKEIANGRLLSQRAECIEVEAKQTAQRRRWKGIMIAAAALLLVVGVGGGLFGLVYVPQLQQYSDAMATYSDAMATKNFALAASEFRSLGSFQDSAKQAEICDDLAKIQTVLMSDGSARNKQAYVKIAPLIEKYKGDERLQWMLSCYAETYKRLSSA